ncbi:hypothetical protein TUM17569_12140 [Klebsiella oxytoca]|nr:hypothetical protein TUM17568_13310 [Klebsiella oxytoca]GJK95753.1 hypothetical protein TUM17569_12140 [Klebsiella oxytoca]
MRCAYPGYESIAVCDPLARTDAQHRLREMMPLCAMLPGAAPGACPGYGSVNACDPLARTDA